MSRKPYKFTAPRKALALKLISEGKTRSAAMESLGLARQTLTMAMKRVTYNLIRYQHSRERRNGHE